MGRAGGAVSVAGAEAPCTATPQEGQNRLLLGSLLEQDGQLDMAGIVARQALCVAAKPKV